MRTGLTGKIVTGAALLGAIVGISGMGACSVIPGLTPGGPQRSIDEFTYISTPWEPLSVTLYDRREDTPLWTVDVPIGSKVSIRFYENRDTSGSVLRPDIMRWEIFDQSIRNTRLTNAMAVPPADSRLLQVNLREDVPLFPDELPDAPELVDPNRTWVPVQPRRFRGVPLEGTSGTYYRAD